MAIVLEAYEVIDLHGVCAGEPPPAVVEVHLPYMAEQHLHGPQPSHAGGHPQDNLLGLLPIDDRRELLGEATMVATGVTGTAVVDFGLSPHVFLGDLSLGHASGPVFVLDVLPSILCRHP
jgi:hypothetical protein